MVRWMHTKRILLKKMHGRIRDQLFTHNSHARSRDTAIAFVEMEVLNHILTGGFFPIWRRMGRTCLYWHFLKHYTDFLCTFFSISYWSFHIEYLFKNFLLKIIWNQHYILFNDFVNFVNYQNLHKLILKVASIRLSAENIQLPRSKRISGHVIIWGYI